MLAVRRAAVAFPSNTFTPIMGLARQQHMRYDNAVNLAEICINQPNSPSRMQTTKPVKTPLRVIKPESAQERTRPPTSPAARGAPSVHL
jgi:succinate dehydrogenase (ubiquinone) cytochrome b560 subunit